jgi:nucleoside-diphosphate-sugar epimerase
MQSEDNTQLPELIETEEALDELLTRPRSCLVDFVKTLSSPLLILGAGGKMGPSLAVLCRRAADAAGHKLEIYAASRFSNPAIRPWLEARGVKTLECDLLERYKLNQLPDAENVIYLVGLKFGTSDNPSLTWAMNTLVPAHVAERYPAARIAALSSGNVYPLMPVHSGGSVESDALTPLGEYANACVGRERIFEFFSRQNGTPIVLVRLNYAVELRYGVLLDIARRVHAGQPVDVRTGHLNCIWQGDANEFIVRSLSLTNSPAAPLNLTGPAELSVAKLAFRFGELMGRMPRITGTEASTALLSNPARALARLGQPPTPLERILHWTTHWVMRGGRTLDKPTHFEVRDGNY